MGLAAWSLDGRELLESWLLVLDRRRLGKLKGIVQCFVFCKVLRCLAPGRGAMCPGWVAT